MGQSLGYYAVLLTTFNFDFMRIGPDERPVGAVQFRVPPRKVLVVTDMDWEVMAAAGGGSGPAFQTLGMFIVDSAAR